MKKFLNLALCCLVAIPLAAQGIGGKAGFGGKTGIGGGYTLSYSIGNTVSGGAGGAASTFTSGAITITAGQALVGEASSCFNAGCSAGTGSYVISDSVSDTWVCPAAAGINLAAGGSGIQLCYVCNAVGGSTTFTNTVTASTPFYPGIGVAAVNGILSSACGDTPAANASTAASGTPSVTSNAVAGSSEFVFAGAQSDSQALTPGQTAILRWNANQNYLHYTIGPASGTQTMTGTGGSAAWSAGVMALKHP
jgi:hypothetical protein